MVETSEIARPASRAETHRPRALIVGAGLGGLLAAAGLARDGWKPVVLERSRRIGGRFTSTTIADSQVTTGALHLVPHGDGGPLALILRELGVPVRILKTDVYASFWRYGEHKIIRHFFDWLTLFDFRTTLQLIRLLWALKIDSPESRQTMGDWLRQRHASEPILALFEGFAEFALALTLDQVTVGEHKAIFEALAEYGLPGVPEGGCKGVIDGLVQVIEAEGGRFFLEQEVDRIEANGRRVIAVESRDRRTRVPVRYEPELVVSDLGPQRTWQLLGVPPSLDERPAPMGLKVHVLSRRSLIPHRGIMFCIGGTRRISGFAQPSNSEPCLAAPGKHLVISFQVMGSEDVSEERALALGDWRAVFGSDFHEDEIVAVTSYLRGWPVNRVPQGSDVPVETPLRNLFLVGDGAKSRGKIMVEGVAASAQQVLERVRAAPVPTLRADG